MYQLKKIDSLAIIMMTGPAGRFSPPSVKSINPSVRPSVCPLFLKTSSTKIFNYKKVKIICLTIIPCPIQSHDHKIRRIAFNDNAAAADDDLFVYSVLF